MDNLEQEQRNEQKISPKNPERVEVSDKHPEEYPPLIFSSQRAGDNKNEGIKRIKKKIEEIGGGDQDKQVQAEKVEAIKSYEDLLGIKETADKLEALLVFAKKGEKQGEKALEWAKEIWEETENAVLLDELRDRLAE